MAPVETRLQRRRHTFGVPPSLARRTYAELSKTIYLTAQIDMFVVISHRLAEV